MFKKNWSKKEFIISLRIPIIYFAMFLVSFCSLFVSPVVPERLWSTFLVFFVIGTLTLFNRCEEIFNLTNSRCISFVFSFFLIGIIIGTFMTNFLRVKSVYIANKNREDIINMAVLENEKEVSVVGIGSSNRFSCFANEIDLSLDGDEGNAWKNRNMARYYGVDKITMTDIVMID